MEAVEKKVREHYSLGEDAEGKASEDLKLKPREKPTGKAGDKGAAKPAGKTAQKAPEEETGKAEE